MSYSPSYVKGDWKALCGQCGRQVKASELRQRWDGIYVDDRCWETRQPQDFVRGVADYQAPPWTRPEPEWIFIEQLATNDNLKVVNGYILNTNLLG